MEMGTKGYFYVLISLYFYNLFLSDVKLKFKVKSQEMPQFVHEVVLYLPDCNQF